MRDATGPASPARGPAPGAPVLPLTGERTGPDDGSAAWAAERYWFARHVVGYALAARVVPARARLVVDAGAGEGYGAAMLARAGGAAVVAVELDGAAAAHAAARYPSPGVVRGNVVALPLATGCADAVVSSQVLEHVWSPGKALDEVRRVLRPGGVLVCTTPNRLTFSPGLPRGGRPANLHHHREYDAGELLGLAARSGLVAVQVLGVHGPAPDLSGAAAGPGAFRVAPDGPAAPVDAALDLVLLARRPR